MQFSSMYLNSDLSLGLHDWLYAVTWKIRGNPNTGHMRVTVYHDYIMISSIRFLTTIRIGW